MPDALTAGRLTIDPLLRPPAADQHLDAHGQLTVGRFILCEPRADLFAYRATVCCAECMIHLWNLSNSGFNRRPVIIETINGPLTLDLFHADALEARIVEQSFQPPWIGKRP